MEKQHYKLGDLVSIYIDSKKYVGEVIGVLSIYDEELTFILHDNYIISSEYKNFSLIKRNLTTNIRICSLCKNPFKDFCKDYCMYKDYNLYKDLPSKVYFISDTIYTSSGLEYIIYGEFFYLYRDRNVMTDENNFLEKIIQMAVMTRNKRKDNIFNIGKNYLLNRSKVTYYINCLMNDTTLHISSIDIDFFSDRIYSKINYFYEEESPSYIYKMICKTCIFSECNSCMIKKLKEETN